jgi:beta-glucosidase
MSGIDRRIFLLSTGSMLAGATRLGAATGPAGTAARFPKNFRWGVATAGHQIEGNNVASDMWLLEHLPTTAFSEPSGDACNSLELWAQDLDLVRSLGLNSYRFSLEWARIEPEPGAYSIAMLDHYLRIVEGCRERGLMPLVTYNHFTCPRWFSAQGGWLAKDAADRFARFCDRATRHLGAHIGYATTLNEPNLTRLLATASLPQALRDKDRAMLDAAARACGTERFVAANTLDPQLAEPLLSTMIAAHRAGRAAIKNVRPDLPVGVSVAMFDDQAVGEGSVRDQMRTHLYGAWLEAAKGDDFIGVQNYERARWDAKGKLPPPDDARRGHMGAEVYPPSLAGAVRHAHAATGIPVMVTEHGVGTPDDAIRAWLIPEALKELRVAIAEGVPVLGYMHWSLMDNFEWVFGYGPKFGLCSVDRNTFKRTPKPSAQVLGAIARRNSL